MKPISYQLLDSIPWTVDQKSDDLRNLMRIRFHEYFCLFTEYNDLIGRL